MQEIFFARQPIVSRQGSLFAFELLFRPMGPEGVLDNTHATAQVMLNAFGEMGIAEVLGPHKGFLNFDAQFLMSDLVELLPKHLTVLELLESVGIDDEITERCRELKGMGFSLALDDVRELYDGMRPLLSFVNVIKVDLIQVGSELPALVKELQRYPGQLLAEKVETHDQARQCFDLGFDLFQGFYFAHPETLSGTRIHPSKMILLRILSLMMSNESDHKIEEAFKENPDLIYSLLRMVNSAAMGLQTKISSLRQALMVFGRQPLQRWVQLLLYASDASMRTISPLMQLAATRGKFMELIARQYLPTNQDYADRAFLVGVLSLLEALLEMPMAAVLVRMNLDEEVRAALLERGGQLGDFLSVCEKLEQGDVRSVNNQLRAYPGLTLGVVNSAELEALAWANNIIT
jgi:c-di-GMP-related signal transduction protein